MAGYINAFRHKSDLREFSFNGKHVHPSREEADLSALEEMRVEPHTRRIGVWRCKGVV